MAGAVLAGDATDLHGVGVGVVEPADQVVDRGAAGIHQQQHGVALQRIATHPVNPLLAGAIQVGKPARFKPEGLQGAARQADRCQADRRLTLQFMGGSIRVGADHAATGAAEPVARWNRLPQQRQQPLQVAGVGGGAEHQGQIRPGAVASSGQAAAAQLGRQFGHGALE